MDELLKGLLEAEILTDDTCQKIEEAFKQHLTQVTENAEQEAETRIRAELTEQFIDERNILVEAVDTKVMEMFTCEMTELKEDIDRFRDLEAEYAAKLVQEKEVMSEQLKHDMASLLQTMDSFLEQRIQVEFDELKEDIEEAKKDRWGRKIFESFKDEFAVKFVDEDSLQAKLHEATERLQETETRLMEAERVKSQMLRESKMNELLSNLQGHQRDVMETILTTIKTDKLDETYNKFIGRIINESVNPKSEKEAKVLAEGDERPAPKNGLSEQVVLKDGNKPTTIVESLSDKKPSLTEAQIADLRRLSGQD